MRAPHRLPPPAGAPEAPVAPPDSGPPAASAPLPFILPEFFLFQRRGRQSVFNRSNYGTRHFAISARTAPPPLCMRGQLLAGLSPAPRTPPPRAPADESNFVLNCLSN